MGGYGYVWFKIGLALGDSKHTHHIECGMLYNVAMALWPPLWPSVSWGLVVTHIPTTSFTKHLPMSTPSAVHQQKNPIKSTLDPLSVFLILVYIPGPEITKIRGWKQMEMLPIFFQLQFRV